MKGRADRNYLTTTSPVESLHRQILKDLAAESATFATEYQSIILEYELKSFCATKLLYAAFPVVNCGIKIKLLH